MPETLQVLSEASRPNQEPEEELQSILQQADLSEEGSLNSVCTNWEELLMNVQSNGELSYSEINQKRKQLTFEAFRQADFMDRTLLLEFLMGPLSNGMDLLLQRISKISALHHLPASKTDKQKELMMRHVTIQEGKGDCSQGVQTHNFAIYDLWPYDYGRIACIYMYLYASHKSP